MPGTAMTATLGKQSEDFIFRKTELLKLSLISKRGIFILQLGYLLTGHNIKWDHLDIPNCVREDL